MGPVRSPSVEIDVRNRLWVICFSANGKYLVSGDDDGARVWRVEDGEQVASMKAPYVWRLALSNDGRWIAAGTWSGEVFMWNALTFEQVFKYENGGHDAELSQVGISAVDFSPNSTRFVSSVSGTAAVWDVGTRRQVQTIQHWAKVIAAIYSPQSDRIATATRESVHVWDDQDGHLLVDIPVQVDPYSRSLFWFRDHLFVLSDNAVKQFEASTGSAVLEWPFPNPALHPFISLSHHQGFIAYCTSSRITFWDTSTHTQYGLIDHSQDIFSIALSPDDRFIAIGGFNGSVVIQDLQDGLPSSFCCSNTSFIDIDDTVLDSWKRDQLAEAEISLTQIISNSTYLSHHAFANRALVRSQLKDWGLAIDDAETSIKIQPSAIGYIAKSVALVRNGETEDGCRVFGLAFKHCDPNDVDHLRLIKAVVLFLAGKHNEALSHIDDLISTGNLHLIYYVIQAYMRLVLGNSHVESNDLTSAIRSFESVVQLRYRVRFHPFTISLISGWKFNDLDITIRKRLCETLNAAGRTNDAVDCLLESMSIFDEAVYMSRPLTEWISDFAQRCLSKQIPKDNVPHCTPVDPSNRARLLMEWTKATLASRSWRDALVSATRFVVPKSMVYRAICEGLQATDYIMDASECFRQMLDEFEPGSTEDNQVEWVINFKCHCSEKLENHGDSMMSDGRYTDAVAHYSAALTVNPGAPRLFLKRNKGYLDSGHWEAALSDVDKVIELDPLSPSGYEARHATLHTIGDYENAISAFEQMLSVMLQSADRKIRELHHQYINPGETKKAIRRAVQDVIRDSPRVLINTISGRLCDKSEQAMSFESLPVFNRLISSMVTCIDHDTIEHEVTQYYHYAMFSHKWEDNEPLFDDVIRTAVYDLRETPTNNKLRTFCNMVRDAGLRWAWSDTCCINKADHFVLQEALVSMFKWYRGSALTLVLLLGVRSPSRPGDLVKSIWNSRVWTFQEYHASKVVRFFNEDWTLYLDLDIPNHKESPKILSEMEEATGIPARVLMSLQPGLDDIQKKLLLASTRQTTLVEDEAYSLLGIFSTSLPVVYGEGNQALGRLLAQLLTSSGDTSILAWTGKSGSFNSCLPDKIMAFERLSPLHIPLSLTSIEMETIMARLRAASRNLNLITELYDKLNDLPVPLFVGKRMKLPCIVFKLGPLSASRTTSKRLFRARTTALGTVEIKTAEDLSPFNSLCLVHPWIDFLLDRQPVGSVWDEKTGDRVSIISDLPRLPGPSKAILESSQSRIARLTSRFGLSFSVRSRDAGSLLAPSTLEDTEKQMLALQVVARLRQPFGALLLTPDLGNVAAYRRVAVESLIMVRVEEITPTILDKLMERVRVLDVL